MAHQQSWVLGHHAVDAVLRVNPERALSLWLVSNANNKAQQAIVDKAQQIGLAVKTVDKRELERRCGSHHHQGVALQAKLKRDGGDREMKALVAKLIEQKPLLVLMLDQVQDPHNFGACLRTADAAGADAVIVAKDNACPMTPVVQKVASGAAETMPVFRVTNLVRAMQTLQQLGVWMIGTSDKAKHSLFSEDLRGPIAIVMGAEGKGLRALTAKHCDSLVCLPMSGSVVSSLNVSVATGISLYEAVRQRAN